MKSEIKAAIIAALGGILAAFLMLLPWLLDDGAPDRVVLETVDGSNLVSLDLRSLPSPSRSVAKVLAELDDGDARRIIEFGLIGLNNIGLIQYCLHNADDQQELAAYRRLEEIGLGTVEVHGAPEALPYTVQADGPDENGDWWAVIGTEMLETMCTDASMCQRSFSFVPSDLGIEVRSFLRDLLVSQIGSTATEGTPS